MLIIKNISIIFLSIFLETLPFLLLGSLISSIIEEFISEEKIVKWIPKNIFLGSIFGIILGFFLPACDCAVIPVTKRLIKKKVPINVAISFMLSSPIINPVVLFSTYYAFSKVDIKIFYVRTILGIILSLIIGIIMGIIFRKKDVLKEEDNMHEKSCSCNICHNHAHNIKEEDTKMKIKHILIHTAKDMFDVLKYLIIGALIVSAFQIFMPKDVILFFANHKIVSVLVLMIFAYVISLCSTSDSFLGKNLMQSFGPTSVVAYLVLGPMIDIKNTIVLLGNFKKKFTIYLISLIFIFVFFASLVLGGILW